MQKTELHLWAEAVAKKKGFVIEKRIYQGSYYSRGKIRNVIYGGKYQGKPAALKAYDDPRLTDEPIALKEFNKNNKSRLLIAPELYDYQIVSPSKGWFIMEELPKRGGFLKPPLNREARARFLELFMEYRKNFPLAPTRKLTLAENLSANQYHIFRISRWLELANSKEAELVLNGKKAILRPDEFLPRYRKGLEIINREFAKREMVWCHGHFKPSEIYRSASGGKFFLLDFAHTKMYPRGYELAFIVWSDYLMAADWRTSYARWRKGVFSWIEDLEPVAKKLKVKNFKALIRASLIERILGMILADICATDQPRKDKIKRISLLYKLFDELA